MILFAAHHLVALANYFWTSCSRPSRHYSKYVYFYSFYFQRSIKRIKTSRSSLPLLRHQEPSTSASTSSSLSSQEILENPSGKPPFDIFSKLLELHEEFKESDEYSVSNLYFIWKISIYKPNESILICNWQK